MRIYLCGSLFVLFSLGLNPFLTAQGFTNIAMKTVIIGAICNIVLDPIFIYLFDMGVRGAALATILSQLVSMLWVLRFLTGTVTKLKLRRAYLRLDWKVLAPVLALGVSPFVMQGSESVLIVAFNASLKHYGGDLAVGAMTIVSSITQVRTMILQGVAQGAQPILGYNYGAGNSDRVRKALDVYKRQVRSQRPGDAQRSSGRCAGTCQGISLLSHQDRSGCQCGGPGLCLVHARLWIPYQGGRQELRGHPAQVRVPSVSERCV